jgi:hypothetical protein
MIVVKAASAQEALRLAKRHARQRHFTMNLTNGARLAFEFVGVRDLLHLGVECEPEEVWYDILQLVRPMERRRQIIPREADLNAIRAEQPNKRLERSGGKAPRRVRASAAAGRSAER